MSQDETDPEEKVEPTVRYLQKLGSAHLDLIFESSKWIFEVDQNAGLKVGTLRPRVCSTTYADIFSS